MVRPYYESNGDRANEQQVAQYLEQKWDVKAVKLPIRYHLDYGLFRDHTLVAVVEIKCRTCRSDTFPTAMVCATKRMHANQISASLGVPCLLVVQYVDTLKFIDFAVMQDQVKIGGRKDRGDEQDIGIMIHYKLDKMRDL